jgi:hypothetical protein
LYLICEAFSGGKKSLVTRVYGEVEAVPCCENKSGKTHFGAGDENVGLENAYTSKPKWGKSGIRVWSEAKIDHIAERSY